MLTNIRIFALFVLNALFLSLPLVQAKGNVDHLKSAFLYTNISGDTTHIQWTHVGESNGATLLDMNGLIAYAVSPNGNHVAFVDSLNNVAVLDLPDRNFHKPPAKLARTQDAFVDRLYYPSQTLTWSPDSEKLAYIGNTSANRTDLYVHTLATDSTANLTQSLSIFNTLIGFPSWSPDGNWIAFVAVQGQTLDPVLKLNVPDVGLIVMSSDSSKFTQIAQRRMCRPVWSPDLQHLASNTACYNAGAGDNVDLLIFTFNSINGMLKVLHTLPAIQDEKINWRYEIPVWRDVEQLGVLYSTASRGVDLEVNRFTNSVAMYNVIADTINLDSKLSNAGLSEDYSQQGHWLLWSESANGNATRLRGYNLMTGHTIDKLPAVEYLCTADHARIASGEDVIALQYGCRPGVASGIKVFDLEGHQLQDIQAKPDELLSPIGWVTAP